MNLPMAKRICGLLLLLSLNDAFSLPDDRLKTMQLNADFADLNQQAHRGVYTGHVQVEQGSTHLEAAEAITEGDEKNQLIKATIKGNSTAQAHYWTLSETDNPPLHAYADIIHYYPNRHLIELIGHARIEQGNDSFTAPEIRYDTVHQHVMSKRTNDARTTIVIHPGKTL